MKTFALIYYLLMSDGHTEIFVEDTGMSAYDCSTVLAFGRDKDPQPTTPFKSARRVKKTIMACEEETGV